jgi:hypothetical protein
MGYGKGIRADFDHSLLPTILTFQLHRLPGFNYQLYNNGNN